MASADTEADAINAQRVGYRTFRVTTDSEEKIKGEVLCPASEEAGRKLQCEQCKACGGANGRRKGSIYIPIHGPNSATKGQSALLSRIQITVE
jgi:cytochrome c